MSELEKLDQGKGKGPGVREIAEAVIAAHRLVEDSHGTLYEYGGGWWREITKHDLNAYVFEASAWSSGTLRAEAAALVRVRVHDQALTWGRVEDHEVALANGVLDVTSGVLRPHRPEDFLEWVIPHPWRPRAACPRWIGAVDDWLGVESAGAAALQEFMGYTLMSHARFKKALVLYGQSNTGKSACALVLQDMVGVAACCQLPVEHMDDVVRRAIIKGKRLNIVTELSADAVIRDGGFKTLVSSEEPILISDKYKATETYQPTAKHVIATNSLPRVDDRSEGTFNRLLIVPFARVIPESSQDPSLRAALRGEMAGIVAWAVDGARRLVVNAGRFTVVGEAAQILHEYRAEANPLALYVKERCFAMPDGAIPLSRLVRAINQWAGTRLTVRAVGQMARGQGWHVANARRGGRQARSLMGFQIAPEEDHRDAAGEKWIPGDAAEGEGDSGG